MTIDEQTLRALAFSASRARPGGAKRWPEPVVMEVLRKLASRKLADVALALFRAADDTKAEMPHVLLSAASPHWRERDTGWQAPREPYDRGATCGICGLTEPACRIRFAADHEFESVAIANQRRGQDVTGVVLELKDRVAKAEPAEVVPIRRNRGADPPTDEYQTTRAAQPGGSTHSQTPGGPA